MPSSPGASLEEALRRIDATNRADPVTVDVDGVPTPRALLYGMRMTAWLQTLEPAPSAALQLAARAQHIARWRLPRTDHPPGRAGYLAWRRAAGRFHAETVGTVLEESGFDDEHVRRVQSLVRKEALRVDDEAQCLEDAACLVFLAHELDDFAARHPREKVIHILRRTWKKMSARGRAAAGRISFSPSGAALVEAATQSDA